MRLELNDLRELLRLQLIYKMPWSKFEDKLRKEYKDITLFTNNFDVIIKQYDLKQSFRKDQKNRYNRIAA